VNTLRRRQIVLVARFDFEPVIPGVLVAGGTDHPELRHSVLIGHGLPFAAGLVILRPNKRANRIDFFTKEVFHFHKTIQTHVLIAKATVGVDALIKALRERDIAESGNGGT